MAIGTLTSPDQYRWAVGGGYICHSLTGCQDDHEGEMAAGNSQRMLPVLIAQVPSRDPSESVAGLRTELLELLADFPATRMVIYPEYHTCRVDGDSGGAGARVPGLRRAAERGSSDCPACGRA